MVSGRVRSPTLRAPLATPITVVALLEVTVTVAEMPAAVNLLLIVVAKAVVDVPVMAVVTLVDVTPAGTAMV